MGIGPNDILWLERYRKLEEYYKKNNNIKLPNGYVTENGIKLGRWLTKQKELYRGNKISEERIYLLEKLGIIWNYSDTIWNHNYAHLKAYYDNFGDINVPYGYESIDGVKLWQWINMQRAAYRNKTLSKKRTELLNELGIKWHPHVDNWDESYYILEDYYNKHGNINITDLYITEDGFKLGQWLHSQKQAYNKTTRLKISKDRIMLLNDLNIDWSPKKTIVLKSEIEFDNKAKYFKIMFERMKHILTDLSYEIDGNITNLDKQKEIEKEIIKRMWR